MWWLKVDGQGDGPRVKNGPALGGHGTEAVRETIAATSIPYYAGC